MHTEEGDLSWGITTDIIKYKQTQKCNIICLFLQSSDM